ncbi:MAG: universal stress protein [Proteobacteria bacterium]|nr:universal stress protein [Pseudomonadota bacterium]MBU4035671.1 universal stress protein [Pseudomonadota bacterium]
MKFEKILFNTRFRDNAIGALEQMLDLTAVGLKEIILVYVIPREKVAFVPYGGYQKEKELEIKKKVAEKFEKWGAILAKKGVKSKIRIEVGTPNAVILSIAEKEKVNMIVAGRKKRTLLERVYVGTHLLDLARRSPIPILMDKYMAEYEIDGKILTRVNEHIFSHPMLATDWSCPSENALETLISLKGLASKIIVAHNIGVKITKAMSPAQFQEIKKESRKRLNEYRHRLVDAGLEAQTSLTSGRTVAEIINVSRKHNASMIVLGRTGKDWLSQYWLGGVSHRVAETSELPVLLIP